MPRRSTSRLAAAAAGLVALVACAGMVGLADAKFVTGSITMSSENCEQYLEKFSFNAKRKGYVEVTFTGQHARYLNGKPHSLMLAMYSDKDWPTYQAALQSGSLCQVRRAVPRARVAAAAAAAPPPPPTTVAPPTTVRDSAGEVGEPLWLL